MTYAFAPELAAIAAVLPELDITEHPGGARRHGRDARTAAAVRDAGLDHDPQADGAGGARRS
jgi:hypothetical protein